MAPPVSQHQFNQFNFGSNTPYDSFRNQRSLPSPNTMNSQFLGLNGNPAAGSPLGYNLAVNTAMHAAAAVSRPIQPSPSSRGIPTGATSLTSGQVSFCLFLFLFIYIKFRENFVKLISILFFFF